jgi:hypothetical protein
MMTHRVQLYHNSAVVSNFPPLTRLSYWCQSQIWMLDIEHFGVMYKGMTNENLSAVAPTQSYSYHKLGRVCQDINAGEE